MPRSKDPKTPSKTSKKVRKTTSAPLAFRAEGKDKAKAKAEDKAEETKASAKDESSDTKSEKAEKAEPAKVEPAPEAASAEPAVAELLHPKQIPNRSASASAPPPGIAPRGDARSFRRVGDEGEEFCLVYRHYTRLITRRGVVGQEGTWDVVEYPSDRAAAHAYANACSALGGEGFYDFRG